MARCRRHRVPCTRNNRIRNWGPTCASSCDAGECTGGVTCDQTTGDAIACTSCNAGYWGSSCQSVCSLVHCAGGVSCNQSDGAALACGTCDAGWSGALCTTYAQPSCLRWLAAGSTTDGTYVIDPDGPGAGIDPFTVWCDMTTDGGGYTFYKASTATAMSAAEAEAACGALGMQLFIPRNPAHLASAFAVATATALGPDREQGLSADSWASTRQRTAPPAATSRWRRTAPGVDGLPATADRSGFTVAPPLSSPTGAAIQSTSMDYVWSDTGVITDYDDTPSPGRA